VLLQENILELYRKAKTVSIKDGHWVFYRRIISQGNMALEPMSEKYKDICLMERRIRMAFGVEDCQPTEFIFNALIELSDKLRR